MCTIRPNVSLMDQNESLTVVVTGLLSQSNMSGRELARRAGITTATLNRRLNNVGAWKLHEIDAIAAAFGMKGSDLKGLAEQAVAA